MSSDAAGGEHRTRLDDNTKATDTLITHETRRRDTSTPLDEFALRYRHRALWLLGFYVPLLLVPWMLTCVLVYHPIDRSSYFDQSGISSQSLTLHRRLFDALSVLNSFTGIVTVPIISALIAQAAVVYAQRRRKTQHLSVRQVFALADRGWSNLSILNEAWPPWGTSNGRYGAPSSPFLWLAAAFLMLCESPHILDAFSSEPCPSSFKNHCLPHISLT